MVITMANRPVFYVNVIENITRLTCKMGVEFGWNGGFAKSQKQKNIDALHESFFTYHPEMKILEISSKSRDELGVKLSAFNLMLTMKSGKKIPVEVAFQAGKIFEYGGPYLDLLDVSSRAAKKDERLKNSGRVIGFEFEGERFQTEPTTAFYSWLYMNALKQNEELSSDVVSYDAFTDIEFNPERQLNCQADTVAKFVALHRRGILEEALENFDNFLRVVYDDAKREEVVINQTLRENADIVSSVNVISKGNGTKRVSKKDIKVENEPKGQGKEKNQFSNLEEIDWNQYINKTIKHPKYGNGLIIDISDKEKKGSEKATVLFDDCSKILAARWVVKNCGLTFK